MAGNTINNQKIRGKMSDESFINLVMFGALLAFFAIACIFLPNFYRISNIINLFTNNWYIIILGIGVTFLLITGNFDMSVGGVIAMTGILAVWFCQAADPTAPDLSRGLGLPYGMAVAMALAGALVIGAINAFFIAKLKVASIIITLGTMSVSRGIGQIVTQGAQRNVNLPDIFGVAGHVTIAKSEEMVNSEKMIAVISLSVLIMIFLVVLAVILEKKTVFGRRTYLIGANPVAAKLSGVKVEKHLTILFLLSSLLAGITGILMASEYNSGMYSRATGYEFDALVIALLGGTSIAGGFGSVLGTVVGALILAVVNSFVNGMLWPPDLQYIFKGIVAFLAIVAQRFALDIRKEGFRTYMKSMSQHFALGRRKG